MSRSALPCAFADLKWIDHCLCARLEHTPVSTWNMMVWARMMTSDLVRVASKVSETNGMKGAHGLGKLKQVCLE